MRNSTFKFGGAAAAAALAGALALSGAGAAQAQGIGGVTSCAATGGKQEAGALMGAVVGGLIGNKVGGRKATAETVIGAGVGAAAGSAIGCQLQHNRANAYARSGTYSQGGYRLSSQVSPASYQRIDQTFVADTGVNLRAAPTTRSGRVGRLNAGEPFQAMAQVRGTDWILVGQGGVGVGYVRGDFVSPAGQRYAAY